MIDKLGDKLRLLAKKIPSLCIVGGFTRNYLIDKSVSIDIDLASPSAVEDIATVATELGFKVQGVYKRTGTVIFSDGKQKYEYTRFRTEKYHGGEHLPYEVLPTTSIEEDAKRRDFKCNAVYFDINSNKMVDPLGGINDIKNKTLDTVIEPDQVFKHDGLRIMRLARFATELDFIPSKSVIESAKRHVDNLKDISVERVYAELKLILESDKKYPFSDNKGHYNALKLLDEVGALDVIFPELTLGRDMEQRADFHSYDVLEHSLRTVLYSKKEVRLAALLHDVGKPERFLASGKFYNHDLSGEKIARQVLTRLKVDNSTIKRVVRLVKYHMYDMECKTRENKIRKFIVDNVDILDDLLALKQADFSAGKDDFGVSPTVKRWKEIYDKMIIDKTPFSIKNLSISAEDLIRIGFKGDGIGKELKELFDFCVISPDKNKNEILLERAQKDFLRQTT